MSTTTIDVVHVRLWREIGADWQTDPNAIGPWKVIDAVGPVNKLTGCSWRHWAECANFLGQAGWDLWQQDPEATPGYPSHLCDLIFKRITGSRR